ncbi:hypothetical protein THF1A12_260076 [Vibrio jasicida]|uniref:Acetyltransferase n=1 Tax=Vibrio jasicida TaxID=766224 RepID=A0AAU9QMG7_9VIBR|nr:hypothetical protein THF1A12_260076 [Vibrio jasicida]
MCVVADSRSLPIRYLQVDRRRLDCPSADRITKPLIFSEAFVFLM